MCRNIALVLTLLLATVAFAVNSAADQSVRDQVSIVDTDVGGSAFAVNDNTSLNVCDCPAVVPQVINWTGELIPQASDAYCTTIETYHQRHWLPILNATDGGFGDIA
jgi:hypothetical protein